MLNTKNDLFQIADGMQKVTFRRSGTNDQVAIRHAFPRVSRRVSYAASGTQTVPSYTTTWNISQAIPSYNATWIIPQSELPERPKDGDEIVAEDGVVWTIYRVSVSPIHKSWRCVTRCEIPDFRLDEQVSIIRAFAETSPDGSIASVWKPWKTGIPVKFAYDQILIDTEKEGLPSERSFRVYFREKPGLLKTDLIERPDGTRYKIRRIRFSQYTYGWTEVFVAATDVDAIT